jgi:DNA invertase Pin-like site-specific DNA recombinase
LRSNLGGDITAKRDRRRKVTPAMIRRMRELRGEGLPYEKIAKRLNLATMTVFNYLKEEKVGFFEKLRRKLGLK